MTEYIGNVPVASIQNVSLSRTQGKTEIDIVDKDSNIVIYGSDEGYEIQIDFTLLKQLHPQQKPIEEQKTEIKSLVENKYSDNDFVYGKLIGGFVLLNEVSLPESSDSSNIIVGTTSGLYLPYPKFNIDIESENTTVFDFAFDAAFE